LEVVRLAGEARQCLARILSDEQELRALKERLDQEGAYGWVPLKA